MSKTEQLAYSSLIEIVKVSKEERKGSKKERRCFEMKRKTTLFRLNRALFSLCSIR